MAALSQSATFVALLAVCTLWVWAERQDAVSEKDASKAFVSDLADVIASPQEANDFLSRDERGSTFKKLGKVLFGGRRRYHHRGHGGHEDYEERGRYGLYGGDRYGDYYGGRYGDRYGSPYGGRYGDRYGSRYGHRYGSRERYEELEED